MGNILKINILIFGFLIYTKMAKEYTRCELAKKLKEYGFDGTFIPAWLCLIDAESGRRSDKITTHGYHKRYGLFQIQSMEYCTPSKKNGGGICKSDCIDFVNENIQDDMNCAKLVQTKFGFKAWPKYETLCKDYLNRWAEDVNKCLYGPSLFKTVLPEAEKSLDSYNDLNSIESDKSSAEYSNKVSFLILISSIAMFLNFC